MALVGSTSITPTKSPFVQPQSQPFITTPRSNILPISAVHAADSAKPPSAVKTTTKAPEPVLKTSNVGPEKWTVDGWKSKKALQLPEYPNKEELESVLKTLEDFPPIVFAGEARSLEERLAEAAMGKAFLLQGGDCAESFKEFNANNIRDTFRILLQMGAVLMFGGQMPVVKVKLITFRSFYFVFVLFSFVFWLIGFALFCSGGENGRAVCEAEIGSVRGEERSEAAELQRR